MNLRTEKLEGVIHVFAGSQHLGEIRHRKLWEARKDGWAAAIPAASFSAALSQFQARGGPSGFRSSLAAFG